MPHPGLQAVFCINDATGEHMWLPADSRCFSPTFKTVVTVTCYICNFRVLFRL